MQLRAFLAMLLVLTSTLTSHASKETQAVLNVALEGKLASGPDHVCVVSPAIHVKEERHLSLAKLREVVGRDTSTNQPWTFEADRLQSEHLQKRKAIYDGLMAMAADIQDGCGGEKCIPDFAAKETFSLDSGPDQDQYLTCTRNQRPTSNKTEQTAVIALNIPSGQAIPIEKLTLDGNVLTVTFTSAIMQEGEAFTGAVLGGHFVPFGSQVSEAGRVTLKLEPRCVERELELPYFDTTAPGSIEAALTLPDKTKLECSLNAESGYASITLPSELPNGRKRLRLADGDGLEYEGTWVPAATPERITLRVVGIAFSWGSCMYDFAEDCPAATLEASKTECPGTYYNRACHYTCSHKSGSGSIQLPETITFKHPKTEKTWGGYLSHNGQMVSGYLKSSEAPVLLVTPARRKIGRAPLEYFKFWEVEKVMLSWGDTNRHQTAPKYQKNLKYRPGTAQYVELPGSSCGENIEVEYKGAAGYSIHETTLEDGRLTLPQPEGLVVPGQVHLGIAIGHEIKPIYATDDMEPLSFGEGLYGRLSMHGYFGKTLIWGFGFEEMIGGSEFFLEGDEEGTPETTEPAILARFLFGAHVGYRQGLFGTYLGLYGGPTILSLEDEPRKRHVRFGSVLTPSVKLRFWVAGDSHLEIDAKVFLFEKTLVYSNDHELVGKHNRVREGFEVGYSHKFF